MILNLTLQNQHPHLWGLGFDPHKAILRLFYILVQLGELSLLTAILFFYQLFHNCHLPSSALHGIGISVFLLERMDKRKTINKRNTLFIKGSSVNMA